MADVAANGDDDDRPGAPVAASFDLSTLQSHAVATAAFNQSYRAWGRADIDIDAFSALVRTLLPQLQLSQRFALTSIFFQVVGSEVELLTTKLVDWVTQQRPDAAGWRAMCMIAWHSFIDGVVVLNDARLCDWARRDFVSEPFDFKYVRDTFSECIEGALPVLVGVAASHPAMLVHLLWRDDFWANTLTGDDALAWQLVQSCRFSIHSFAVGHFSPAHPLWAEFKQQWDAPIVAAMKRAAFHAQTTLSKKMAADAADLVALFLAPAGTTLASLRVDREVYNAGVDLVRARLLVQAAEQRRRAAVAKRKSVAAAAVARA